MLNRTLNHYKVVARLGKGGMGEVWAAEDTRLGRKVALKVLPPEMATNAERRARFEREAKAVAALNHPNIVTIHSVEEAEGVHFLTMELVDGKSLSEIIPQHGMALTQLLDRGIAMADALSAAHKLGITHRDLKPDNIMIGADGRLKVLDFGLAKLRDDAPGADGATHLPTQSVTQEGKIVGTVAYMSPEQAEGKPVDARSDVFSMGIVLYQMATGRRPFQGDTAISTISAILKETPPSINDLNQSLPRHLGRVIGYCLAKDPDKRYQSALELRRELEGLREESASGELNAPAVAAATAKPASSMKWIGLAVGLVGLVAVALLAMKFLPGGNTSTEAPAASSAATSMEMTRLTSSGHGAEAAISPDGGYVAFLEREPVAGHSLWVSHVGTGSKVQVVDPSPTFFMWDPTFSPRSDYIFYCGREQGAGLPGLYRVPVLGGAPRKIADNVSQRISFSPDGERIVFNRDEPGTSTLVVSNVDGSDPRVIASRSFPEDFNDPSWSPDGKTIAAAAFTFAGGPQANIVLVSPDGGDEQLLFDTGWGAVSEVAWLSDGSGLVFDGFDEVVFFRNQIWEVSYPQGVARRITHDLNQYGGIAVDGTGNAIVTTQYDIDVDLWVVTPDGSADPVQLTRTRGAREGLGLGWTPDGKIVYSSSVGDEVKIWSIDPDGSNPRQITSGPEIDTGPSVTPDGKSLIFASRRSEKKTVNVWASNLDGSDPRQLTRGVLDTNPGISPDGQWVVYIGGDERNVMKVPIEGGDPIALNDRRSGSPQISPDGKWIAAPTWDDDAKRWAVDIIPFEGGEPRQRMDIPGRDGHRWSPDGLSLTVDLFDAGAENLFDYPLDGGERRQLTHFEEPWIGAFAWSPDGKRIVMARGTTETDVVLLRDFR